MVVIPTEGGGHVALHEPVKTTGKGLNEIELRRLSPEEKQRRRLIRNIVLAVVGIGILVLTAYLMK